MRLVLACVLVANAAQVRAEPIAIRAAGSCPSAEAITRALPNRAPQVGAVELAIEEIDGGVIVRATSASGPLEARLEGRDCAVLASAVAAIADAWFVELPSRPEPQLETQRPEIDTPAARDRITSPRWSLAVGRAFVFADRASQSATTQAELGWWFNRHARLRARFGLGDAMMLDDVVRRRAFATAITVAPRLDRGRLWVEAAAGVGLVLSRVERMAPADEVVRAHGAFATGAGAGVRLGAGASLRLDLDALVYPVRDVYTAGSSTIARSPRAELAAGLGLEIAFGARSR